MSPKYTRVDIKPPQGPSHQGQSLLAPLLLLILLLFLGAASITLLLVHPWNSHNRGSSSTATHKPKTHSTSTTTTQKTTTLNSTAAEYTNASLSSEEVDELFGGGGNSTDPTPTWRDKQKILFLLEKLERLGEKLTVSGEAARDIFRVFMNFIS